MKKHARNTPPMTHKTCDYCGKGIEPGKGGKVVVPASITGYLAEEKMLHNACLNPCLRWFDENRKPFPLPGQAGYMEWLRAVEARKEASPGA